MRHQQPRRPGGVGPGSKVVALAAGVLFGLSACAGSADPAAGPGATASGPAPAATTPSAAGPTPAAGVPDDPCALLSSAMLGRVFDDGAPAGEANSYGAGFAECDWEQGDRRVRLSLVPPAKLRSDYIDKLNQHGPVPALGTEAMAITGLAGIGFASGGGVTVAFTAGGTGVLVAVRTADRQLPAAALPLATELGRAVADRLG